MSERSCLMVAREALLEMGGIDADRDELVQALDSIIAKRNIDEAEKIRLAQVHMAELEGAARRKKVADTIVEGKLDWLDSITGSYDSSKVRVLDDIVRNNVDPTRQAFTTSIESRRVMLRHKYLQRLAEPFDEYTTGFSGRAKDTTNLSRELLGVDTGDAVAKRSAELWREVYQELAARLRKTGVFVQSLKDHHPQRLSPSRLADNKEQAIREMAALLDPEWHPDARESAEHIYRTYMTRHTLEPGDQPLTMGRKVHYRTDDPDRLVEFLQKYGEDDVIRQIERQVNQMTRALAASEILGPDPGRVIKSASRQFLRNAADADTRKQVEGTVRGLQRAWDQISGTADTPENPGVANIMSGIRSSMTTIMLGKVAMSIVAMDSLIAPLQRARVQGFGRAFALQAQGAAAMLSRDMRGRIRDYYATLEPAFYMGSPNSRFSPDPNAEGFARGAQYVGSGFYRASGAWDAEQALRGATSYSMGKSIGYAMRTPWDELEPRLQQDFAAGGLTKQVWDEVNKTGRVDDAGLFVWDKMPVDAGEAVGAWFYRTLDQSVLRPDATTMAWMMAGGRRGSLPGELAMMVTHFLSWPIAFARIAMYQQLKRGAPQFAIFGGTMLTASVVTEQLYQITAGAPAYEWDSPDLWSAGLARSGLLTPIGDWVWAYATGDEFRQPGLGPAVDVFGGTLRSGTKSVLAALDGDTDAAAAELIRVADRLTPNTFWFESTIIKPAVQSAMESLDPQAVSRQESRWMDEERMGY